MPKRTYFQIALTLLLAIASTWWFARLGSQAWLPFCLLLLACICGSGLKVELPQSDGAASATFPLLLIGLMILSPLQSLMLAALSVVAQSRKLPRSLLAVLQLAFNTANAMLAMAVAYWIHLWLHGSHVASAPALAGASLAYFAVNSSAIALVLASTSDVRPYQFWRDELRWYVPFYLVGALLASMALWLTQRFGWMTALLLVPAVYAVYRAYKSQLTQARERKRHLEETEALHLRTIEGLSMAIEAKDQNTHDHLFRVRAYVQAVGEALELDKLSMQALQTAAFLHDIGKLAVPEHIVNKPGKLTPEEFEKMKIHPVVGADILERVRFPYPVTPIVRSHHEWWNGTGYPDGLRGEQIPIGARILTVVDCFDAMVSDRPYRKGMSNEKALGILRSLAGKQFDPDIVAAFERCHAEAERRAAEAAQTAFIALNTEIEVSRGEAPGAGFEAGPGTVQALPGGKEAETRATENGTDSLSLIAAASQEAQALYELSQSLGNSLTPEETVSVMVSRLRRLVPFDTCVLYLRRGDLLEPRFMEGEHARAFTGRSMALGEGVSGWVAQSGKPLLNGNAGIEPGCASHGAAPGALQAALCVPMFDLQDQVFGVLTLYAVQEDCFRRDHLRILQAMEAKLSLSLSNALQVHRSESEAETDFLTELPNARRLFLQLTEELKRCDDTLRGLAVVVCDLNGFKQLNDKCGHFVGNRVLREIARRFQDVCRTGETVARMGGDEFVFLLPHASKSHIKHRLAAIASAIEAVSPPAMPHLRVTASLGVAYYPADGTSAEELLATADRRMCRDKRVFYEASRNRPLPLPMTEALVACD